MTRHPRVSHPALERRLRPSGRRASGGERAGEASLVGTEAAQPERHLAREERKESARRGEAS